jgi:hypothetical protein
MFEFFNKKESAVPDINKLEALRPRVEAFKFLLREAGDIEDAEEFRVKMIQIEREFDALCLELKKTVHGEQYFREKEGMARDSLETNQDMIQYMRTPLEGFNAIEKQLRLLERRLENSLHDDKYSD